MTQRDIADAIRDLMLAGKKMPEAFNGDAAKAKQLLKATVELWAKIFLPMRIGVERWRDAVVRAITLTKIGDTNLNVNLITPALMKTALEELEREHLQDALTRHEQEKKGLNEPVAFDDLRRRANLIAIGWTKKRLAEKRPIMPFKPTYNECVEFGTQLGLIGKELDKQLKLIEIYLNDKAYATAQGTSLNYTITLNDGRVDFIKL
ncbi:hypothetical protein [Phascolarctobacterium sp.]|uniref:hypothetical protein n=1 Tax=Phascolarctobacterium sp. TaxID=2049039 RepID=UPI00386DFEA9